MPKLTGDPAYHPPSSFEEGMQGSCLCGSITIKITQKSLFTQARGVMCHCSNCRRMSGARASHVLCVSKEHVELSDPNSYLKVYLDNDTLSGGTVPRGFCSNCGASVGHVPSKDSDEKTAYVCVGMLPRVPKPVMELFTASRHPWEKPIDGVAQHAYHPQR